MITTMYNLCVSNNWFTGGTSRQYDLLFNMVSDGRSAKELALVIYICSDNIAEDDIYRKLREAGFEG